MDASLERLKARIEKLNAQKQEMEEKYIQAVAHLVQSLTQKEINLPILTGMVLNAGSLVAEFPSRVEGWQIAGEKFLLKSKNKYDRSGRVQGKTPNA